MCLPVQSISFQSMAGQRSSSTKMSHLLSDHILTVSVPTFFERADEQIEVTSLNSSDIDSLKTNDPFMYYSIPAARNAAMKGQEVDPSLLHAYAPSSTPDTETRTGKASKISCKIRRQRRVSTECHPDLLLDQTLCNSDFKSATCMPSEDDDQDDYFLSFLEEMTR
ncbi:hypothetical protein ACHAWX_001925 [Stephanocyclus meneghinianus]